MAIMARIDFINPQPMKNWKLYAKPKEENNQEAPKTGNANGFLKTKEGQALLARLKKPQPDANGYKNA